MLSLFNNKIWHPPEHINQVETI